MNLSMGDGPTSSRARRGTLAGQQLAGHELVRVLAAGGMGEVYLARHLGLDMLRAIKVIRNDLREHDDARARFAREAQVLARLSHNSIVQIIDFGALPNGWPYLVMEYIDGPNLDQVIEASGPMALTSALGVLAQIASALRYAHKQNVIHRDLKPGNVLLRSGDVQQVKVIDFGLAYTHHDGQMRLTVEGTMMGSPLYMAPEQAEGNLDVTAAVDVYALGGVAYTLISGQPPFHGMSVLELISAHDSETPQRLSERCPQAKLPRRLDDLLFACLAKAPSDRPRTDELLGHLSRLAASVEIVPAVAPALTPTRPLAGTQSAIARLLDAPPEDDGSGVAPALVNQVFAIVGDLAMNLSSDDYQLGLFHSEIERARAELTDVEMELALIEESLEQAAPAQRAAITDVQRTRAARVRNLNTHVSTMLREMIARVEQQRGRADGTAQQLFSELDQVLDQLGQLPGSSVL
jgi:serine/threonine-protein kinase